MRIDHKQRRLGVQAMLWLHFLHSCLCTVNYVDWVQYQKNTPGIGPFVILLYLIATCSSVLMFTLVCSACYSWAYRYESAPGLVVRRCVYGILAHLLFSDAPIFVLETMIVWRSGILCLIQALSFASTCLSLVCSTTRVWTYTVRKIVGKSMKT